MLAEEQAEISSSDVAMSLDHRPQSPDYASDGEVQDAQNRPLPVASNYEDLLKLAADKEDRGEPASVLLGTLNVPFVSSRSLTQHPHVRFGLLQTMRPAFLGTSAMHETPVPVCVKTFEQPVADESEESDDDKQTRLSLLACQRRETVIGEWLQRSFSSFGITSHLPRVFGFVADDLGHTGHVLSSYAFEWLTAAKPLSYLLTSRHLFNAKLNSPKEDFRHAVLHAADEEETKAMESRVILAKQTARAVNELHKRGVMHGDLKLSHIMVTSEHVYKQICRSGCLPRFSVQEGIWRGAVSSVPRNKPQPSQLPHSIKAEGALLEPDFCNLFAAEFKKQSEQDHCLQKELINNRAAGSRVTMVGFGRSFISDSQEPCPPLAEHDLHLGQRGFQFLSPQLNHWLMDEDFKQARDEETEAAEDVGLLDSAKVGYPTFLHPIALRMLETQEPLQISETLRSEVTARRQAVKDAEGKLKTASEEPPTSKKEERVSSANADLAQARHRLKLFEQKCMVEFGLQPDFDDARAIVDNFALFEIVKQILFGGAHDFDLVCTEEPPEGEAPLAVQHFVAFAEHVRQTHTSKARR